jgi:hypothetical protein
VHRPVWFALIVTVAVETPEESVEDPTVQRDVVDDEKVTTPPDEVLAETTNI